MSKSYRVDVYKFKKKKDKPDKHLFSSMALAMDFMSENMSDRKLTFFLYKDNKFVGAFGYKMKLVKQQREKDNNEGEVMSWQKLVSALKDM